MLSAPKESIVKRTFGKALFIFKVDKKYALRPTYVPTFSITDNNIFLKFVDAPAVNV